jgi:DtxR family Mn-dependent transcriptional regulator
MMTQSLEDYLEAVYMLISTGRPAQVRDVARSLSVKMPSVVKAVHELKRLGLVTQEPYANIELTVKGRRVAKHVLSRHTLIRSFLLKLGVTENTADRDACLMEHILSAETLDKIRTFTERQ